MKLPISLFFALLLLFSAGCARHPREKSKKPHVAVSIPPYVFLVKEIVGDTMTVHSVLGESFDPHTTEVTLRQMAEVQDSDLFIAVGEGHEKKFITAIREKSAGTQILEMDKKIPLLEYREEHSGPGCDHHSFFDLHFWLGPKSLTAQTQVLIATLCQLQPVNTNFYRENGARLIQKIEGAAKKWEVKLQPFKNKAIIISHPALGYFCHDYQLVQIAVEFEGKNPRPRDIAEMRHSAEKADVICVFTAPQFDNRGAELLAVDLNFRIASFEPLGENPLATIEHVVTEITK